MEAGGMTLLDKKYHLPDLRIVLLGRMRSGKSSAGNTILGREEFKSGIRTAQCVRRQDEVAGRQVTVVDTPGWIYMSVKDTPELVKQEIMHSVSLCPPGPCALLLVISMSSSFTESHRRSVEQHLQLLSERVWRHTIVLFTWGDCLGDTTIEQHIETKGQALQWLVEKCGNRFHVLNNKNRGDGTQVTELLEKVEEMVAGLGGCHYEMDRMLLQEVEEKSRTVEEKAKERMLKVQKHRKLLRAMCGDKKYHLPDLRIVLLGGRWNGKSAAGNTILGREEFQSGLRTAQCVRRQGEVAGRQVTVVDTPGWRYIPVKDTPELVTQEIIHSVFLCPPGPCAFLLVISVSSSFTESHRRSVEQHLQLLSERVWSHTIVLFTCGDCLGDTTIEQHIETKGKALQWLVEKCGNRYHVLNNENRGDGTQVTELLEKAEEMVAGLGGCHYEMDRMHLQEVEKKRRQLQLKSRHRAGSAGSLLVCYAMSQPIERRRSKQIFSWSQEKEDNIASILSLQDNMEAGSSGDGVSGPLLSVQRHDHIGMPLCPPNSFHRGRSGICEMFEDSAHWTLLEPCTFRENDICRYRFTCPPGRYECQESGLRWVCVVEVSLQYHYCSWENFEEQLNSLNCTIGGPLLDITVTAGHLDEIHVPHFICLGPDPSLSDRVKVLHVADSGVSLEGVCEVSCFHVKILQPTFSPMGVVVQNLNRLWQRIRESRLRVHCHLLVFHGRKKAHLTLHIYLIPNNPALKKSVEEKEQKLGSVRIYKPSEPERSLQLKKKYKLTTSCTVTIIPQSIKLKNNRDPPANYFEVYVEQPKCIIGVSLIDEEESVWTTEIRKGDYSWREDPEADQSVPSSNDTAVRFVDDHRAELIQRVSLVKTIADTLLQKSLISGEAYSRICTEKTSQEQMRMLYQFLDSGGPKVKFFFYTVLLRMDYPLVEDLGGVLGQ